MLIDLMPQFDGKQLYPNGFPLPADQVLINGQSVLDIFLSRVDDDPRVNEWKESILNNYYRYHILAPCFKIDPYTEKDVMEADGDFLFEICMELGLDPL